MHNGTSIYEMMMQGWPVLSVLLLMSIFSVTTIVDRVRTFRLSRANSRAFAANIVKLLDEQGEAAALEYCRRYSQPVAVVAAGIAEALITTACGLLVAIPALMAYNYCVHQVQKLADDIDDAMYFVIERLTGGDDRRV